MKRGLKQTVSIVSALFAVFLFVGCAFPAAPGEGTEQVPAGGATPEPTSQPVTPPATPEPSSADDSAVNGSGNMTDLDEALNVSLEEVELKISGNTKLQKDLTLCPHLARKFECDRYDVRACKFKQRLGDNGYFPDYMRCRAGETAKGERHDSRYCFIQECSPMVKGNIAESYGGYVAYAEYDYRAEKTADGGVMTYYDLLSCGEEWKEFETQYDCQIYYADWRQLWD